MKEKFKRVVSSIKQILIRYINFIKLHKKQVLLSLGLLLMVFIPTFLYVNLTNPTKINKYIAHVINKGAPANEYFEDEIFYKVVVDAYNRKNNTSLPYTTNLTDEQLKTITSLSYSGYNKPDSEKISSAKGIEKLISLTLLILQHNNLSSIDVSKNTALISLKLHYNNLSSIDVSHNVKLERLYLQDNNLNSIDVSKNAALKDLGLGNNNLSNIDVSKNTALKDLGLSNNNLSSIDVSKNTALKVLSLNGNSLNSIDVSKNTALKVLSLNGNSLNSIDVSKNTSLTNLGLYNNNLSNIDVSKNTALKDLGLGYNNLSSIDLSKNTELTELGLGYNNLSSIDVSKNTALKDLDLDYNKLSTIDLSENTSLWRLNLYNNNLRSIDVSSKALKILGLSNNNLSSIDLSKNTALMNLSIFSNNLSSIDLSKNTELTELDLDYNNLNNIVLYDKFDTSKLKSVIGTQYSNQININLGNNKEIKPIDSYKYYLGVKVVIPNEVDVNTFKENLGLNNLTVKIFNGETEKTTGQVKQNDILKIYDDGNLMQDIPINIMLSSYFEDNVFYKAVVDAYNSKNNTSLPYTTNLTDEQLKTITSLSYYGNNKPISERIYNAKGIERLTSLTHLDLSSNNISNIDLSKNASLTELDLSYNNISNIDLSKNMFLNKLYTNSNKLEYIDLSKNINLQYYMNRNVCNLYIYGSCDYNELNNIKLSDNILVALDLGYNSLSSIDLSKNTELTELDLSNNNISGIDLSKNTELTELDLSNNNISGIDLSKNTELTELDLDYNNISSIDLSKNTELTELILGYNNLNSIDVSHNVKLKYLYLHNNSLNSIDVSKNTSLTDLTLYDNPLILKKQRLLKGKSVSSNFISNIKLPEGSDKYFITYEMEDNTIASFSDNKITGLKSGKTNLVATLNGVKESGSSSSSDMRINGNILVYDLTSSKYDIKHDEKYIYVGADSISSSLDNIKLENISGKIEDNKLVLYDGDIKVDEYRLVGISSSTYDLSNEYIYTGTNTFDKSKITCINCTLEESNNTLNIKYGSTTLKSYKIVSYSSSTYDLSKDYIYIGINTFDKSKITCTNCTLEESGNTLNIKYGSTILKSYKLVSISSNKYDLSKDNIRLNKDEVFDINSISVINGTKEYSNNRLYIRYNSDILKVYNITYRLKGDVNNDGKITNADVSKLFAYYKGKIKLAEDDLSISDLNNDGKITNADVSKLFAYYKGKIKEL